MRHIDDSGYVGLLKFSSWPNAFQIKFTEIQYYSLDKRHDHIEHVCGSIGFAEGAIIFVSWELVHWEPLDLLDFPLGAWYKLCVVRDTWDDVQAHKLLSNGCLQVCIGIQQWRNVVSCFLQHLKLKTAWNWGKMGLEIQNMNLQFSFRFCWVYSINSITSNYKIRQWKFGNFRPHKYCKYGWNESQCVMWKFKIE